MTDVIDRVLAALNAQDIEQFVACYAEDATIEDGFDNVIAQGRAGIRERYAPMFAKFTDVRVNAVARTEVGDFVVQEEEVKGRSPGTERHVAVYLVRDGLIARERLLRG